MPWNPLPAREPVIAAVAVLVAAASLPAAAQAVAAPAAPAASLPGYLSAFDGYRGQAAQPLLDWREANDRVARIGGWKAYLRDAQGAPSGAPADAAGPDPAAAAGSAPPPHRGAAHRHHPPVPPQRREAP